MKSVNPKFCEVHSNGFLLDIKLFPSTTSSLPYFDLLGSTVQIGKPAALKIVKDTLQEKEPYKQVILKVLDKEYDQVRLCIKKTGYKYKITDIEQSVVLGYLHEKTFEDFSGYYNGVEEQNDATT